eukprot:CAMPEP_0183503410 /NCGR_PEP_ID=MMETSP0371-20130417/5111_1 /TAXON_ID=268820 /ORGANISM="Peridinium aciculiferum, Strain PAER-2" /LENGTH=235 /DNA_ID=CAMNT_0025698519 /DNA_START=62 /DNA_END=769 /DNA_ORIENTATION=+
MNARGEPAKTSRLQDKLQIAQPHKACGDLVADLDVSGDARRASDHELPLLQAQAAAVEVVRKPRQRLHRPPVGDRRPRALGHLRAVHREAGGAASEPGNIQTRRRKAGPSHHRAGHERVRKLPQGSLRGCQLRAGAAAAALDAEHNPLDGRPNVLDTVRRPVCACRQVAAKNHTKLGFHLVHLVGCGRQLARRRIREERAEQRRVEARLAEGTRGTQLVASVTSQLGCELVLLHG